MQLYYVSLIYILPQCAKLRNKRRVLKTVKKKNKFVSIRKELKNNLAFYLLPIPGLIALILFNYLPMAGLYIVFTRYTYQGGIFGSEFVGLKNFEFFFSNLDSALKATRNTLAVNVSTIILGTIISVAIAIMMNELRSKTFKKVSQSVMFFPYFISWIAFGAIMFSFMDEGKGFFNTILHSFGIAPIGWYSNAALWWPLLIIFNIWKNAGYNSIIYYAAITGFDTTMYEAAAVDGASRTQQIFRITIPQLIPTISILTLLSIGGILNGDLSQVLGLTNLNPLILETTDNINTYVYRTAVQNGMFESASAVQLYQSIFGFLLVMVSNYLVKKYNPDNSIF